MPHNPSTLTSYSSQTVSESKNKKAHIAIQIIKGLLRMKYPPNIAIKYLPSIMD